MSKLQVKKYVRKPFEIEAVQVTHENFDAVAQWCKGHKQTLNDGTPYIKVKVFKPMGDRQTEAHIGDWVLFFNGGYKVYLDPSFTRSFEEVNNGGSFDNVIKNASVTEVSLVAEGPNPAAGVHPIEVKQAIPGNAFTPSPTPDDTTVSPESSEIKTELLRADG